MNPSHVIQLARFIRLGTFPLNPSAADWARLPHIPAGARVNILAVAKEIAEANTLPDDMPASASVADYYPGRSDGPFGHANATVDVDIAMSRPGEDVIYRHVRVSVPWDDDATAINDAIADATEYWKKIYGDYELTMTEETYYVF